MKNGYSLVEVLVAVVIISVMAASLLIAQKSSVTQSGKAKATLLAGHLIEQGVERLRVGIAADSAHTLPTVNTQRNLITDSDNNITVDCSTLVALDKNGGNLGNVRTLKIWATRIQGNVDDTLIKVVTCISRDF